MQLKPITAIIVLSLVLASLLVSGCTNNNNNNNNQTPSASTEPNADLVSLLAAVKNSGYSNSNLSVKAWEVTWTNSTTAHVQSTWVAKPLNYTWNRDATYMVFPTSQDATNYLNAMNKTVYSLASTEYPSNGAYKVAMGHAPQIFKDYIYNEGNPYNISEFQRHEIAQIDKVIYVSTEKVLYTS